MTVAAKKQIPLRLNEQLYNDLAEWAEAEFRSHNEQYFLVVAPESDTVF